MRPAAVEVEIAAVAVGHVVLAHQRVLAVREVGPVVVRFTTFPTNGRSQVQQSVHGPPVGAQPAIGFVLAFHGEIGAVQLPEVRADRETEIIEEVVLRRSMQACSLEAVL